MNILLEKQRETGFTLVEIAVVLVILALLAAFFASNLWRSREDAQVNTVVQWFMSDAPRAIGAYQSRRGSLEGLTKDALVERGLNDKTEWKENWTLAMNPEESLVTVTYTITQPKNSIKIRDDIVANLKRVAEKPGSIIDSVTDSGTAVVVVVRGK